MLNKSKEINSKIVSLQLLGLNDFHGQLNTYKTISNRKAGGAEYLGGYLKDREKQNPNTLTVYSGDMVGASPPVSALLQDEPTIEVLGKMGVDIGGLGNHEFDEGVDEMLRLINGGKHENTGNFKGAEYPFVAANVVYKDTNKPVIDPYIVKEVEGVKVGFIGIVTSSTPNIVIPSAVEKVLFLDEAETINKYTKELKEQGVKSIVVLAHEGASSDLDGKNAKGEMVEIASIIDDEVDVIMAGHNHGFANTVVDNKLIVESYSYGTAFSDVDLEISYKTKDIVKKSAEVVTTFHDAITPDFEIKSMVDAAYAKVKPILEEVIGNTDAPILKAQNADGESAMGNMIADSMRAHTGTDFAFMNPGGVRSDINAGPITWEEVFTVQPFGNDLVTMELTGQQIADLLGQQWISGREKILQISGLKFTFESTEDAQGKFTGKVHDITLPDGTPLDMNKTYTATVNNFMAGGGDGYSALLGGKNPTVDITDLDALIKYVKARGTVNPVIEGRTTKINK
ncbi:bifunctional metallophosphatase/5'-nucleotidase [Fictibacillus aquaticus]|uniref:Bifunctional metallophosphatase/5'-nucleotidase n=2 Tax=Fictibacillus aquaticus TaxID=2021314 RepID=A0A235F9N7_9BACL|nr:bifunctional metallophosphatase/5'-nucleotidase [Fictibacillus aquaticus]